MDEEAHDWLVFHRLKLKAPVDGTRNPQPAPKGAGIWRFAPQSKVGDNGKRSGLSDVWGGFGRYATRAEAEAVLDAPEDHVPFLSTAEEAWHALLVPFSHRGKTDWSGTLRDGDTLRPGNDPGGPLVVLTSAGYVDPAAEDPARIEGFLRGVDAVMAFYATLPGLVRQGLFSGGLVDGRNGVTFTLWATEDAMLGAAYRTGEHRAQLDHQRTVGHFDYSSFTRTRVVASRGTWEGSDPVAEAA